jgi:hypothetical protein
MDNSCNKTSNNKYFGSPARMDDGRAFTDYRSSSSVDDMIRYSNNVMNNYEYRQFLIHNADNIINVNNKYTQDKIGNVNCNQNPVPSINTVCDVNKQSSKCNVFDKNGIGLDNIVTNFDNQYKVYAKL